MVDKAPVSAPLPVPRWAMPPSVAAPSPIDFSKLLDKLLPPPDGEDMTRLRTGIVSAVNADGTLDVGISGLVIPGIARLSNVSVAVDAIVNILVWRGGLLVIGASHQGATGVYAFTQGRGTTTSTVFVLPTTNSVGVAFVAPPSGRVRIDWSSELDHSVAGGWAIQSPRVLTGAVVGSGSVVLAASDDRATRYRPGIATNTSTGAGGDATISNFYLLTGLTPGAAYNVQLYARVNTTGTGGFELQTVMVEPR